VFKVSFWVALTILWGISCAEFEVDQGPNQLHGHLSDTAVAAVHGHYHQFDTAVEIGALPLFQGITIGATVVSVDLITGEDVTTTHVTLCDVSGRERGAVEITILLEALVEAGVGVQSEGDHVHCHDPLAIAGNTPDFVVSFIHFSKLCGTS
jgi:hypothetical protein